MSHVGAILILAEIGVLLIVPTVYYTYFHQDSTSNRLYQSYSLTNSQIKSSWNNLPSAQEIWNSSNKSGLAFCDTRWYSLSYVGEDYINLTTIHSWDNSSYSFLVQNKTDVNIPNLLNGGITPMFYHIWLQYNNTVWIEVPQTYLVNTANPPSIPALQNGFLGTKLPTVFVDVSAVLVTVTLVMCLGYWSLKQKKPNNQCKAPMFSLPKDS